MPVESTVRTTDVERADGSKRESPRYRCRGVGMHNCTVCTLLAFDIEPVPIRALGDWVAQGEDPQLESQVAEHLQHVESEQIAWHHKREAVAKEENKLQKQFDLVLDTVGGGLLGFHQGETPKSWSATRCAEGADRCA